MTSSLRSQGHLVTSRRLPIRRRLLAATVENNRVETVARWRELFGRPTTKTALSLYSRMLESGPRFPIITYSPATSFHMAATGTRSKKTDLC